jgi:hypothetical protein
MPRSQQTSQLDPEADRALGQNHPRIAWMAIEGEVVNYLSSTEYRPWMLGKGLNPARVDNLLRDVFRRRGTDPVEAINLLIHFNPHLKLHNLPHLHPPDLIAALLNTLDNPAHL